VFAGASKQLENLKLNFNLKLNLNFKVELQKLADGSTQKQMAMKRQLISAIALAALAAAAPPPWSALDVSWSTPSASSQEDGMPTGNGRIAALVWGNATSGGLDFVVRSPMAMATDSTLLDITTVSLTLTPNPCAPGSYWNQTHHLE
jgi:hypothetical protein